MFLRMYWKLNLLELIGALTILVFFAPAIRSAFLPTGVTVVEHSDHRAVVELSLPSYQIETRQGITSYSAITLDAPGWTTWRDTHAESATTPVLLYRLPTTVNATHADLHILEQETENYALSSPLATDRIYSIPGANVEAHLDTSNATPAIIIQWHPFAYSADSRQLLVQRRVKIQIDD